MTEKRQRVFDTGLDHGLFYEPRPVWVDRVVEWVNDAQGPGGGDYGEDYVEWTRRSKTLVPFVY